MLQRIRRLVQSSGNALTLGLTGSPAGASGGPSDSSGAAAAPTEDEHAFLLNPFTEARVLVLHQNCVRVALQLDAQRMVSGDDSGLLAVWNVADSCLIRRLEGHSSRITCIALLQVTRLASAATDRTIRLWEPNSGQCLMILNTQPQGSVNCIIEIQDGLFCCGGEHFSVYSSTGQLVGFHPRYNRDSNIHALLAIKNNRVVAASDSELVDVLSVGDTEEEPNFLAAIPRGSLGNIFSAPIASSLPGSLPMGVGYVPPPLNYPPQFTFSTPTTPPEPASMVRLKRQLTGHRDSVRCLLLATEAIFATASLDGIILLWSAYSLSNFRRLNYHEIYKTKHTYLCSVSVLLAVDSTMLAAAIGHGFAVYNINTGDVLARVASAHEADIQHMLLVGRGRLLLTCASDANIRLWSLAHLFEDCTTDDVYLAAKQALDSPELAPSSTASFVKVNKPLIASPRLSSDSVTAANVANNASTLPKTTSTSSTSTVTSSTLPHHPGSPAGVVTAATATATTTNPAAAPHTPATPSASSLAPSAAATNPNTPYSALATPSRLRSVLPPCIGEMMAHSGAVNQLVGCGPNAFASCGSDHLVILWKNGAWQWQQSNLIASHVLKQTMAMRR